MITEDVITAGTAIRESMEKLSSLEGVKVAAVFVMVDRKEKGRGEKGAMQEIEEEFGFPVYAVADVYDIMEYLEENPGNEENVTRIKKLSFCERSKTMRSIIDIKELSVEEIDELVAVGKDIIENPAKYAHKCDGKKLATLFFEPSTRTRLSFEAAMYELGGQVLTMADAQSSSASKGESVADTAKVISCYADIIAMRHPKEGAPMVAAMNASIPVINAGDGGHNHPTQTLADLLTISREKGRFDNLTIGFCGDLKFGRTVHSLIAAMSRYKGVRFVLVSPDELKVPSYVKQEIKGRRLEYMQATDLVSVIPQLDILYMTRVRKSASSMRRIISV